VRATVLVETILAAFEMEEILYELRDHAAGLNAGRWDYIFSAIKKLGARPDAPILPDRAQVTMTVPFMRAYTELLVKTCHGRGAHAIGGMAAFIPNRRDPAVTESAVARVRDDKLREAGDGFDGTWVAHPDLVPVAMAVFAEALGDRPHQKERRREDVRTTADQLADLHVPGATVTDAGVRLNVNVALQYLEAWLRGSGAVAIHNLMEDAATAEISRAQLWQWVHRSVSTVEGTRVDAELYRRVRTEELDALEAERAGDPAPARRRRGAARPPGAGRSVRRVPDAGRVRTPRRRRRRCRAAPRARPRAAAGRAAPHRGLLTFDVPRARWTAGASPPSTAPPQRATG
jgi:malate synthase